MDSYGIYVYEWNAWTIAVRRDFLCNRVDLTTFCSRFSDMESCTTPIPGMPMLGCAPSTKSRTILNELFECANSGISTNVNRWGNPLVVIDSLGSAGLSGIRRFLVQSLRLFIVRE